MMSFCRELKGYFMEDLEHSEEVSLELHRQRSLRKKITESFSRIFSPLL
jgi:hypothetical protein